MSATNINNNNSEMSENSVNGSDGECRTYKLVVVGDSGVGKTNILLRFCENNFQSSHLTTIGSYSIIKESILKLRLSK